MNEDEIPLEIRPIKRVSALASPQPECQDQSYTHALPQGRENANLPPAEQLQSSCEQPGQISMEDYNQPQSRREREESTGPTDEIPLILSPTSPIRRVEDFPSEGDKLVKKRLVRTWSAMAFVRFAILFAALALLALWLIQGVFGWAVQFASIHPTLGYLVYGLLGILVLFIVILLSGQYRAYRRLDLLGDLQERLERARACQVSKADDEQLRREFQARVDKLQETQVISSEVRRSVLTVVADVIEPGAWVETACIQLLRDMDERVKQLIEREARLVGVSTALSPSGPLDTVIVLWRNTRLILRIAEIYGVRPGGYGNYRLLRRVVTNMVVAGLGQEAMQMLYAAYGPVAIEAASRGFRNMFDLLSKGGIMLAALEPITGSLLAVGGEVGKGASDIAGTAAAQITGPLLQGVLNAIYTTRIGLAAQNECRLLSLNADERRTQSAGIVSALLGFFLSVRRTALQPAVSIIKSEKADSL